VNPDPSVGRGAGTLGGADVVGVGVGAQHGLQVIQPAAEVGHGPDQQVPVAGRAGVDQQEPSALLDQVEVHRALRQPVDAFLDLHGGPP
jgi:hypothetical protein